MSAHSILGLVLIALALGFTSQSRSKPFRAGAPAPGSSSDPQVDPEATAAPKSNFRAMAVRYQVKDVDRSIAFYTEHLGFKLEQKPAPAFASISNGPVTLWLSGPKSSGSRPMPDGRLQEPGGWNRLVLEVDDLSARAATLKEAGVAFRNEIETGPGGKQIQIEDPDGNPIELFQPAAQR
ncbi:MAG: VOC family protein [Phycisphaerales bacterium]|nr:VOC family protein [Phycisphaerales bacterium]MCI0674145.1 VOC family protein [Phycisphaerales bacterium]